MVRYIDDKNANIKTMGKFANVGAALMSSAYFWFYRSGLKENLTIVLNPGVRSKVVGLCRIFQHWLLFKKLGLVINFAANFLKHCPLMGKAIKRVEPLIKYCAKALDRISAKIVRRVLTIAGLSLAPGVGWGARVSLTVVTVLSAMVSDVFKLGDERVIKRNIMLKYLAKKHNIEKIKESQDIDNRSRKSYWQEISLRLWSFSAIGEDIVDIFSLYRLGFSISPVRSFLLPASLLQCAADVTKRSEEIGVLDKENRCYEKALKEKGVDSIGKDNKFLKKVIREENELPPKCYSTGGKAFADHTAIYNGVNVQLTPFSKRDGVKWFHEWRERIADETRGVCTARG